MKEATWDDVIKYINSKVNNEEFIINIFFDEGGEKCGKEQVRYGGCEAGEGEKIYV